MFKRKMQFDKEYNWEDSGFEPGVGNWSEWREWEDHDPFASKAKGRYQLKIALALVSLLFVVVFVWLRSISNEDLLEVTAVPIPTPITTAVIVQPDLSIAPFPTNQPAPTNQPTNIATAILSTNAYLPQELGMLMLRLINEDRQAHGLTVVEWDPVAATAGQHHADDMVAYNYFSHWNLQGLGPEHRYTQVGGVHVVFENLHSFSYTYEDGSGAAIENWPEIVANAQEGLMNSPGHRANILDPAHTHVGVGMAYNAETGQFRLAQMFTNQYVTLTRPLPIHAQTGQRIVVRGQINGHNLSNGILNLAYEPFSAPMSIEALNQTGSYASTAESLKTWQIPLAFDEIISINDNYQPGYYYIRIFVDLPTGQAPVLIHVVTVR